MLSALAKILLVRPSWAGTGDQMLAESSGSYPLLRAFTVGGSIISFCAALFLYWAGRPFLFHHAEERRKIPAGGSSHPGAQVPSTVKHDTSYFKTSKGHLLYTQTFSPPQQAKGIVFHIHGFGDNSHYLTRVYHMRFVKWGYKVVTLDLLGHGWSDGVWVHIENFDEMVSLAYEYFENVKNQPEHANVSHFLAGESMGGAVALRMLQMHGQDHWSGCCLLAPMCKVSDEMRPPDVVIHFLTFLARFFPTLPLIPAKDMTELCFRERKVWSIVEENVLAYGSRKCRLATGVQLLAVCDQIQKTMEDIKVPLLVVHGDADKVTDPAVSRELVRRASSNDKTLRLVEGMFHSILGEPESTQERIWTEIMGWLDQRSST
eukprot:gb/GEZN01010095.1/.p1 GENE.gb/GEZN01010095.1/~~gb/GEZN01010095.1/.p1  ORF type:complete len:375 (-),score=7.79 gb/GEZN01010095.1/:122-1246(-)